MTTLTGVALLAASLALVVAGAEVFFAALLSLATRLRVAPFVLTVVVSGFEVENLAAGVAAGLHGLPDVAAGTFLGGSTFLALGVSGTAAVLAPIRARLPGPVLAWTAAAPLPLLALGADGVLSRGDGLALVGWFAAAMVGIARAGRDVLAEAPGSGPGSRASGGAGVWRLLAGLALLSAGGAVLGEAARRAVAGLGVSPSLLGNTVVAAAVEGEEIARVAVPARRSRGDVALGNVVGTIVHFVGFNAGVVALVVPLELGAATRWLHLPAAAAATILLAGTVARCGGLSRAAGAWLLAAYGLYLAGAVVVGLGG
ncbi:calcium/sodium antiporter [soil metagenome]